MVELRPWLSGVMVAFACMAAMVVFFTHLNES